MDKRERLRLTYENLVGLAAAGVVSDDLSEKDLALGLRHVGLEPKSSDELAACMWVVDGALCGSVPRLAEFLRSAVGEGRGGPPFPQALLLDHSQKEWPIIADSRSKLWVHFLGFWGLR
ncbi:unnamed protein product [Polarella glacialis]|uniref:Uncharacterized protein n=1 Tax=Polarella glacialis TaxID=89957 RepID=A0A813HTX5_POLGL|nr:unnamed protein product [Polarella glacialis]